MPEVHKSLQWIEKGRGVFNVVSPGGYGAYWFRPFPVRPLNSSIRQIALLCKKRGRCLSIPVVNEKELLGD